jgi:putative hydrolase of the HAD superfamily
VRPRLITFDLDDTLWPVAPVIIRAEHRMRDLLDAELPELNRRFDADAMAELRREVVAAEPEIAHRMSELRKRVIHAAIRACDHPDPDELTARAYAAFIDARHDIEYFEDALDTLEHLANHFTLGALSNGNADVARLGLERYFAFHLSAEGVGRPKPEPDMFEAALQRAGVGPDAAVHIGDHPKDDVLGAARLGMATVWVNRAGTPWELEEVTPTWEIKDLAELSDLFPG